MRNKYLLGTKNQEKRDPVKILKKNQDYSTFALVLSRWETGFSLCDIRKVGLKVAHKLNER